MTESFHNQNARKIMSTVVLPETPTVTDMSNRVMRNYRQELSKMMMSQLKTMSEEDQLRYAPGLRLASRFILGDD